MPSPATEVDAGGRPVRVSSPDRVIYEESACGPAVTKLEVVEYYVAVADGIMRALRDRPTALERWPKGVHPGIVLSTRERGGISTTMYQRFVSGMRTNGCADSSPSFFIAAFTAS